MTDRCSLKMVRPCTQTSDSASKEHVPAQWGDCRDAGGQGKFGWIWGAFTQFFFMFQQLKTMYMYCSTHLKVFDTQNSDKLPGPATQYLGIPCIEMQLLTVCLQAMISKLSSSRYSCGGFKFRESKSPENPCMCLHIHVLSAAD